MEITRLQFVPVFTLDKRSRGNYGLGRDERGMKSAEKSFRGHACTFQMSVTSREHFLPLRSSWPQIYELPRSFNQRILSARLARKLEGQRSCMQPWKFPRKEAGGHHSLLYAEKEKKDGRPLIPVLNSLCKNPFLLCFPFSLSL